MAFGDILGQPISGQQYAQGPMPSGQAGVAMVNSGPTYGNILQAAMQYGSKPGSSGPMFGGMLGQKYGGMQGQGSAGSMPAQGAITNALQPLTDQSGSILDPQQHGDSNNWLSMLLKAYLGGAGGGMGG